MIDLKAEINKVKGIGEAKTRYYKKLDITTVEQLIRHFPRDYHDFTKLDSVLQHAENRRLIISAKIAERLPVLRLKNNLILFRFKALSSGKELKITLFNTRYAAQSLIEGKEVYLLGNVDSTLFGFEMSGPEIIRKSEIGALYPIYSATSGLSSRTISSDIQKALSLISVLEDPLPKQITEELNFPNLLDALRMIHSPKSLTEAEKAMKRFSFEELFYTCLALRRLKSNRKIGLKPLIDYPLEPLAKAMSIIPTGAQKRAVNDIKKDFRSGFVMNRMLQGDVGSGKTMVAAFASYIAAKNSKQVVVMAPTEVLAVQHYKNFSKWFSPFGIDVALFKGGMSKRLQEQVKKRISNGEISIVIGTHALFYANIDFHSLELIITDEQQRFGVAQRAAISSNSYHPPHVLVMSATPIPRTLSLVLHGDLDISVIDEMPKGRKEILTYRIDGTKVDRARSFIYKQLKQGRQAYIVCPLIESQEETDIRQASALAEELAKGAFIGCEVELLHGKMRSEQKEEIMGRFVSGEIDVLVTTTIIEVGVDVANASVMMIENAERFGLSQLHQLRGRVGRGEYQSYCILVSDSKNETANKRLDVMVKHRDGFYIAEQDLQIRGPGELLGLKQHGIPAVYSPHILADAPLIKNAAKFADEMLKTDPQLKSKQNRNLNEIVNEMLGLVGGSLN